MKRGLTMLAAALALSFGAEPAAQAMFKCRDAAGKITYAGDECGKLGLKPGGEIQDRSSVAPAFKPPPKPRPAPDAAAKAATAAKDAAARADAPKDPERRCFTVTTSKGKATRCNDEPEQETRK